MMMSLVRRCPVCGTPKGARIHPPEPLSNAIGTWARDFSGSPRNKPSGRLRRSFDVFLPGRIRFKPNVVMLASPGPVRLEDRASIGHDRRLVRAFLQGTQPVGNRLARPDGIVVRQVVAGPRMHRMPSAPTSRDARRADRIDQPVRLR